MMASRTAADEGDRVKSCVPSNAVRLSIVCVLFAFVTLLYGCTYFSLRCQLQQLQLDVDQLKAALSVSVKSATAAGDEETWREGLQSHRRSKRHDAFNESAPHNDTTPVNEDTDEGGSGEVTDQQYRGIWMGTYSRVPMSAIREYCLAMIENCAPPIPGSPGARGPRGEPGELGQPGLPGTKGDRGADGPKGQRGSKGDRGERGEKGDPGRYGVDGVPGTDGVNGTDGQKGRRGKRGRLGEPGMKGEKGEAGVQGAQGPPGQLMSNDTVQLIRGPRGMPGPPGLPGPKGDQGDAGDSCGCVTTESTTMLTTTVEPTIEPRVRDCGIRIIGKPLYHNTIATYWGMWLKDSNPHEQLGQKFWLTKHFSGNMLYYYNSLENVKRDQPDGVYQLQELFMGTGNVVYNGSFYYHHAGSNEIIRFDLVNNETARKIEIPAAAYQGTEYLYSSQYSFFDLAVDENGLWAIYAAEEEYNHLLVSKLNADDLKIQKTWNISVRHREYGNGFVACGLLYLIRDIVSPSTTIDYALDLYTKQRLDVNLRFNNPYHMNNMIAFNHAERQIYSWDRGHLLTYPLLL